MKICLRSKKHTKGRQLSYFALPFIYFFLVWKKVKVEKAEVLGENFWNLDKAKLFGKISLEMGGTFIFSPRVALCLATPLTAVDPHSYLVSYSVHWAVARSRVSMQSRGRPVRMRLLSIIVYYEYYAIWILSTTEFPKVGSAEKRQGYDERARDFGHFKLPYYTNNFTHGWYDN